ncbi:undecaprenyl-diphosphatase [Clostridium sp. DSM 8431]|uniref:phosphatase PAP2 family protein n=1 Tax=Clostridium sp. DSM 8431 TaxID=1761781 RepID=UPI0008EC830B|nr:phosphatase PAP2 family protein [Clostridium sp. DSM 8431]SFU70865.1 undecaprenyl-diphosphatase [Clostridium sp. DSM 8431]
MQFIQNIDTAILMFIQNHFTSPLADSFMVAITSVGNVGALWIAITLIFLVSKKYRKYGLMLFASLVLCSIIGNLGIKPLVARPRPYNFDDSITLLIDKPRDFSFPSGHTMVSFASATIIYYMNRKLGVITYILAALIAFSRLYLYVHYFSDVLAGLIIGILISKFVIKVEQAYRIKKHSEKNVKM